VFPSIYFFKEKRSRGYTPMQETATTETRHKNSSHKPLATNIFPFKILVFVIAFEDFGTNIHLKQTVCRHTNVANNITLYNRTAKNRGCIKIYVRLRSTSNSQIHVRFLCQTYVPQIYDLFFKFSNRHPTI